MTTKRTREFDDLIGVPVEIGRPETGMWRPVRPCGCGATRAELRQGITTHPLRLRCDGCGRHIAWLDAVQIRRIVRGERPT